MPGVSVIRTGGHSGGHQAIIVRGPAGTVGFIGDLFMRPWGANPRWISAFDDYPLTSVAVKAELFRQAADEALDGGPVARAAATRGSPGRRSRPLPVRGAGLGRRGDPRGAASACRDARVTGGRGRGRDDGRQQLLRVGGRQRTVVDGPDDALGIDEVVGRQAEAAPGMEHVGRAVEGDGVRQVVGLGVVGGPRRVTLPGRSPRPAPSPSSWWARIDIAQHGRLDLAGRTPARPEVDPHRSTAERGQADRVAIEVVERDRLAVVGTALSSGRAGPTASPSVRSPMTIERRARLGRGGRCRSGRDGCGQEREQQRRARQRRDERHDVGERERPDEPSRPACRGASAAGARSAGGSGCSVVTRCRRHTCGQNATKAFENTASQSNRMAKPITTTSAPPMTSMVWPCRSSGRVIGGRPVGRDREQQERDAQAQRVGDEQRGRLVSEPRPRPWSGWRPGSARCRASSRPRRRRPAPAHR